MFLANAFALATITRSLADPGIILSEVGKAVNAECSRFLSAQTTAPKRLLDSIAYSFNAGWTQRQVHAAAGPDAPA